MKQKGDDDTVSLVSDTLSIANERRRVVSQIVRDWEDEVTEPDAQLALTQHASLRKDRLLAVELAYEAYCLKRDRGADIDPEEYSREFPTIYRSLIKQIAVDDFVQNNPSAFSDAQWPTPGDLLLDFLVLEELGRGAFARAYICSEPEVGNRQVVLKIAYQGSFEANTMGRLTHPNIMPVHSVNEEEVSGLSLICMPFHGRSTLRDVLDVCFEENLPPKSATRILQACTRYKQPQDQYQTSVPPITMRSAWSYVDGVIAIASQLCDALAHAHERGVLHGDLKPSNVVMSTDATPFLVDFNLSADCQSHTTLTGGTLPYMPPEQIQAVLLKDELAAVNEKCDVFSLAGILFELLCGVTPFGAPVNCHEQNEMANKMLTAQRGASLCWPTRHRVPSSLQELVKRCLSLEPSRRPTMVKLGAELRRQLRVSRRLHRAVVMDRRKLLGLAGCAVAAPTAFAGWLVTRPSEYERALQKGIKLANEGEYLASRDEFDRAVLLDEAHAEAVYFRGQVKVRLARDLDSRREYLLAEKDVLQSGYASDRMEYREWLAFCRLESGNLSVAEDDYRKLIKDGYESGAIWNNLGVCLVRRAANAQRRAKLELFEQANKCFQVASELEKGIYQPYWNRAKLLRQSSDSLLEILEVSERAAELSNSANPHLRAATTCVKLFKESGDQAFLGRTISHLQSAWKRGYDVTSLLKTNDFFDVVEDAPEIQKILGASPPRSSAVDKFHSTVLPAFDFRIR